MTGHIKICGICTNHDARAAAAAGADYVGVILAPGFRRSSSVDDAARILDGVDVQRVGVFVDAAVDVAAEAARRLGLAALQLHGMESPATVARLRRRLEADGCAAVLWKVIRVHEPGAAMAAFGTWAPQVDGILLDGWSEHVPGGAGIAFRWDEIASHMSARTTRLVVAGGLTPDNVADAIALLHPDVVDVSSGVEDADGRKSAARVKSFIDTARAAFRQAMEPYHE
jgi:phosphoribosylanthranilate isomerase